MLATVLQLLQLHTVAVAATKNHNLILRKNIDIEILILLSYA